jgi:hypothetical protein
MNMGGQGVRKPMQGKRGLVGNDTCPFGPEPGGDQILMLARREVDQPVDSAACTKRPPDVNVVNQELRRVARLGRLLGGEQTLLARRCLEKTVPVRAIGYDPVHAQKVN